MATTASGPSTRRNVWIPGLLIAFLVGLLPGTVIAWRQHANAQAAERDVSILRVRDRAAMSSLYARRGDYEQSRSMASSMFDAVRNRIYEQTGSEAERTSLRQLLTDRDKVITLLARSDPAGVDVLQNVQYRLSQALPVSTE